MEPEGSSPHSQVPAASPYHEPHQSVPFPIPLPEDLILILSSHLRAEDCTRANSEISRFVRIWKETIVKRSSSPYNRPWRLREGGGGGVKYNSTRSLTSALGGSVWSTPRPGRSSPEKETCFPLYRVGPNGRSWKTRPPTGVRSWYQPVRSESQYRPNSPGTYDDITGLCAECQTSSGVWGRVRGSKGTWQFRVVSFCRVACVRCQFSASRVTCVTCE